jgi:hypothetical protein
MQLRLDKSLHKCELKLNLMSITSILFVQNSFLFTRARRTYPVYAVGDYTPGQQYYAATTSNFTTSTSSSNGNGNNSSYIVPVDEAILGVASSRGSPQTISTVSILFIIKL